MIRPHRIDLFKLRILKNNGNSHIARSPKWFAVRISRQASIAVSSYAFLLSIAPVPSNLLQTAISLDHLGEAFNTSIEMAKYHSISRSETEN